MRPRQGDASPWNPFFFIYFLSCCSRIKKEKGSPEGPPPSGGVKGQRPLSSFWYSGAVVISSSEIFRLKQMSQFEDELRSQGFERMVGLDEVGRGPLAGPVVAAACFLPEAFFLAGLDDSKKLDPEMRERLYKALSENSEVVYGIGVVDAAEIDRINILQATFLAMQKAVLTLPFSPDYLLVDGDHLPPKIKTPGRAIVEGDSRCISIAAASIIAKVTRDRMMEGLDEKYPLYGFKKHKGYATLEHRQAIELYGICDEHRKSFDPIRSLLEPSLFDLL